MNMSITQFAGYQIICCRITRGSTEFCPRVWREQYYDMQYMHDLLAEYNKKI